MASVAIGLSENTQTYDIDRTIIGTEQVIRFSVLFTSEGPQVIAGVREEGVDFTAISIADLPPFTSSSKQAEVLATLQQSAIACIHGKVHFLPDPLALYRKWKAELINPTLSPRRQEELQHSINSIDFDAQILEQLLLLEGESNWLTRFPPIRWAVDHMERWGMIPSKEVVGRLEKRRILHAKGLVFKKLGLKYGGLSFHQTALICHQNSLNFAIEINDRELESAAYDNLGTTYLNLDEYGKAIEFFEKSLKIAQKTDDLEGKGSAYLGLGVAYSDLGEYGKAIEFFEKSSKIAQKTGGLAEEGIAYMGLGSAYSNRGKYGKAIEFFEKLLEIAQKTGELAEESSVYRGLGIAYSNLGEYGNAISFYEKLLETAQKTGDLAEESIAHRGLGFAYNDLREYGKAVTFFENSLKIAEQTEDLEGLGSAYCGLGHAYGSLGEYWKDIDYHEAHLEISRKIGHLGGQGAAYYNLGNAYLRRRDYLKAMTFFESSLKIAKQTEDLEGQSDSYYSLGMAYSKQKKYPLAIQAYKKSMYFYNLLQKKNTRGNLQRGIHFFQKFYPPFLFSEELLIRGLVAPSNANHPYEALRLADNRRARALSGLLAQKAGGGDEPLSVKQMQEIAAQHQTTFLLYSCSPSDESKAWVWVIPSKGEITHRFLDLTPMKEEMKIKDNRPGHLQTVRGNQDHAFLEVTSRVTRSPWVPAEAEVLERNKVMRLWYQCLIEPIKAQLPPDSGARLTIVPDTDIADLPFSLFRGEAGETLLEHYTLTTVPSIQTLTLLGALDQKNADTRNLDQACIVANPEGIPLPGAEKEGKTVAKFFKQAELLTEGSATLTNVKQALPKAGFIHFACHSQTVDKDKKPVKKTPNSVFQGSLQLADSQELFSEDFMEIPLNAKLVVLGGCFSGRGALLKEGVVGPIHALLAAGASTVVGTRWAIDDQATRFIIEQFYHFYFNETPESQKAQAEGRLFGAAEALREALLFAKQEAARGHLKSLDPLDPDFTGAWGAFFLVGLPG